MTARKVALWSIPAIGAALGVLGIVHGIGPDREAIRAELAAEIAKVEAMPADDPVRKDRRIHELQDVEDYKVHAQSGWQRLEKLHNAAHPAAQLEEEARKKVLAFLGRNPDDPRAALDECRALLDFYGGTRYGAALRERQKRLAAAADRLKPPDGPSPELTIVAIQRERLNGRFAKALKMVDDAMRDFARDDAAVLKLRDVREEILKSSKAKAEKLLAQASADRKPEPLEKALPDFSGLPEAGRIEAMIRQLRGR